MAKPVAMTHSTAALLIVGRTPGRPRQTGQQWLFGAAPSISVEQPQNILLAVLSWQWISMPMTASYRVATGCAMVMRQPCDDRSRRPRPSLRAGRLRSLRGSAWSPGSSLQPREARGPRPCPPEPTPAKDPHAPRSHPRVVPGCLLYTSDAADE